MTPHGLHPLKGPKQGMRLLRDRQRSIDLSNTKDALRLKNFLKIARVSAYGAIVIDAGLIGENRGQSYCIILKIDIYPTPRSSSAH